ncbi:MAG: ATP-binding protein [Janthinobacterium lividum]
MADGELYMAAPMAIGLVYWGRKALDIPARLPRWDRWLTRLWRPAAAITTLGLIVGGPVLDWLDNVFMAFVLGIGIAIGWQLRAYRPALWLAVALLPATILLVGEMLVRPFNKNFENGAVDNLEGLVLIWLGAFLLVARNQAKTLNTEAQTRLAAEQEQRAIETQSQTLEYEVGQRTAALTRQTDELRTALAELQATQDQLIQSEKMASLGELTAGIAHEIQNPLNFVNNFADVSVELVAELAEERARPTRDRTLEAELLADLRQNLQRIAQHGGRAAGIVRGMLEHSRASTGERQPTDVNALADEYLRLAYHGLRAKDKSFNATMQPALASGLPLVEAVPGDLGRVLLNLLTNAFYAVQKRQQAGEPGYAPTVGVRTEQAGEWVKIVVSDNGTGMSAAVRERIFQPFFTTKPSGEGTGLGLSLSHDIIVQGHGGTLGVASTEGQGTEFTILLPA